MGHHRLFIFDSCCQAVQYSEARADLEFPERMTQAVGMDKDFFF